MNNKLKQFIRLFLTSIFMLSLLSKNVYADAINKGDVNNADDIRGFMDDFFEENMKKYSVPGAAVIVVKDEKVIFKKGYGYSNLEEKIKVNPDKTVFPAASVSKLFTATAIMQLVEDKKIDLNEDVEKYIKPYKIINKYNKKVTCANLLTHSSGIDEASELNGNILNKDGIKSQEYYFQNHPLRVVREPDVISRYSNQGYNLLGFIIEKVSGITYEEYLKKNILEPLSMNNSSVRLFDENIANGYEYINGSYEKVPLAFQYTSGSSGINATVSDMKNFMIASLNNGKFGKIQILKESTSKKMQDRQFCNNDVFAGMGYGFIRSNRNGQEILKHEGALPGYTTTLFLMPNEKLGIYVATNSTSPLPFNIEDKFLDKFYPKDNINFSKLDSNKDKDFSKYEGVYRSYDGISKSTIMKIGVLFDESIDLKITDNKDGTLTLNEYTRAKEKITTKLIEVKENVFEREDGKGYFAFKVDGNKVKYAFNDVSHDSFERVQFYEYREIQICLLLVIILIFIINIIYGIVKRKKLKENKINFLISIFNVIGFVGAIITTLFMIYNNTFKLKIILYLFLIFLIISSITSIIRAFILMVKFIKFHNEKICKPYEVILMIANLIFILLLYYFNFLGFNI